ncbi:tripartite tricarboxylate transporter TctB family protein [Natrialbaceae archaeon AArc-T1-2]|uniref:tripartite tricarboxylate transporter TctB family protein n=1 Tax=Natrialbaceae archaeon AArc-T1-2 TaxID=3053904 RepID=UPI00255AB85C|nr:tripartite tricarboxylate transporter TctB family protein [Natrialbaceae archaeon AArc-T1-2]WIV65906.1 tripartite tricarboxylate transporter TctB family protein [Natrialbaceae archaeon AArc-T1-2]
MSSLENEEPLNGGDERTEDRCESIDDSFFLALVKPLVFPTLGLVFALLYLHSTYGRIDLSNLTYPYVIIGSLLALLASVYVSEIRSVVQKKDRYELDTKEALSDLIDEWKMSIVVCVIAVVYVGVIDTVGFFTSSALAMIALMSLSDVDYKVLVAVTVFTIGMIYVLFIGVLDVRPPEGFLI